MKSVHQQQIFWDLFHVKHQITLFLEGLIFPHLYIRKSDKANTFYFVKQAAMDPTPLNSFKECLFKPAPDLKEYWKSNPEEFNELFKTFQDDDIDEFENQLVTAYSIHHRSRK